MHVFSTSAYLHANGNWSDRVLDISFEARNSFSSLAMFLFLFLFFKGINCYLFKIFCSLPTLIFLTSICYSFDNFIQIFFTVQRPEIVEWVNQGGGEMVADQNEKNVHFIVERHGVVPCQTDIMSTYVSSHWVHSCLEVYILLNLSAIFGRFSWTLLLNAWQWRKWFHRLLIRQFIVITSKKLLLIML